MSDGYTKLFASIIHSTVWQEPPHVKIVWVTLLAMADQHGEVLASIPGLAKAAGVELTQCEDALAKFKGPDPYSRTQDHEGRRIEDIDGGWFLLNHHKYRYTMSYEDYKAKAAQRQKKFRDKKVTLRNVTNVTSNASNDKAEAEAEAKAKAENIILGATAPKPKAERKPREKKPTTGPSIAEILKTDGTHDGDRLHDRYWITARFWDSTKNPKPREAAIEYRKLYDAKQNLREVADGASAYRSSFLPPNRQKDETQYMIGFLEWLKQEGWQNYIEREAM